MIDPEEYQRQYDRKVEELAKERRRLVRWQKAIEEQEERINLDRGPFSSWTHPERPALARAIEKVLKDEADLHAKRLAPAHGDGGLDPEDVDLAAPKEPKVTVSAEFLARLLVKDPEVAKPPEEDIVVDEAEVEAEMKAQLGEKKR
jgi:hypothetical protein